MESMRRVMESVERVFAAERANQVGKARGDRRDGWSVKYARVLTRVRDMIAAAHKTVGAVGPTLLRHIGVVNGMASKLEISMDCSKLGEPGTPPEHHRTHHGAPRTRTPEHPGTARSGAVVVRPQAKA
jgi:hypothetical protein